MHQPSPNASSFDPLAPFSLRGKVVVLTGANEALVDGVRELGMQWARYGIRVNALCPGMFPSEMTTGVTASDEIKTMFESAMPLGRPGRDDELDGALAFLASNASSYMTGQTLVIDGGVSC